MMGKHKEEVYESVCMTPDEVKDAFEKSKSKISDIEEEVSVEPRMVDVSLPEEVAKQDVEGVVDLAQLKVEVDVALVTLQKVKSVLEMVVVLPEGDGSG